jgi:hypothetical protein
VEEGAVMRKVRRGAGDSFGTFRSATEAGARFLGGDLP